MVGGARNHDGIEGRNLFPAEIAIPVFYVNLFVPQLLQPLRGHFGQVRADLKGINQVGELRQNCGLVTRTRTDFQHLLSRLDLKDLGHQGHDVRLRDRLALPDGERMILVGLALQRLVKDFKFFVFGGQPLLVQVDVDRYSDHRRNLYDPSWRFFDVVYSYPNSEREIRPPAQLGTMLKIAETLGSDFDFVRVDLYEVSGQVKFGEMTSYPEGGMARFDPESFDAYLGGLWRLPPAKERA